MAKHDASGWDWTGSEGFRQDLLQKHGRISGKNDEALFYQDLSEFFDKHVYLGGQPFGPVEMLEEMQRGNFLQYLSQKYKPSP